MACGTIYKNEGRSFSDEKTGAAVRQITDSPDVNHHPFYYLPAYDDAMARLIFVSHRTDRPEIHAYIPSEQLIVQLSDHDGIHEWSVHPSHDGRFVYFTAGTGAWRLDTGTFREECLADFGTVAMVEKGMVAAAMGTTSVSRDDRWWAVPVKAGTVSRLAVVDTSSGRSECIVERDTISHPQFHPDDANLLRYAGPFHSRIWTVGRNGDNNHLVYERDAEARQWIVHETWRPGSREILVSDWPKGILCIDTGAGAVRKVCSFNAWHASVNRAGTLMCADTTYPDLGLMLFAVVDGPNEPRLLCESRSSNVGAHWNTDHCPYDDGPVDVYAPQHTHPHPAFAPDGRRVVFTSDRTGSAQVYEVVVPEELIGRLRSE